MEKTLARSIKFVSVLRSSPTFLSTNCPLTVRCICYTDLRQWKFSASERSYHKVQPINHLLLVHHACITQKMVQHKCSEIGFTKAYYSESRQPTNNDCCDPPPEKKLSVFQKMKQLTKDYWHILLPVHIVTSLGWVTIFYVAVKNGVDIMYLLEKMNLSEKYLEILKTSGAGTITAVYALYKIFTPLRYTVTVGCTTMAIRYLNKLGLLKASSFKLRPIQQTHAKKVSKENKEQHKAGFKGEQPTEPPKT